MPAAIAKILTCKLFISIAKSVLLAILRELAKRSDNSIDDSLVDIIGEALNKKSNF